jgi:hypothetical protein
MDGETSTFYSTFSHGIIKIKNTWLVIPIIQATASAPTYLTAQTLFLSIESGFVQAVKLLTCIFEVHN